MGWVWGDCGLGEGLSGLWLDDCGLGMGDCGWFAHPVGRQVEQEEMPACELVRVCVCVCVCVVAVCLCVGDHVQPASWFGGKNRIKCLWSSATSWSVSQSDRHKVSQSVSQSVRQTRQTETETETNRQTDRQTDSE